MNGSLSSIIDRRVAKGKSAENRKKFLDRVRQSVRESMPSILNKGSLRDVAKGGGQVKVERKTIQEPSFRFGKGGANEHVLPGNKEFVVGDKIKKPSGSSGRGNGQEGSEDGGGEDSFIVQISREEFLNYLFEDLELPDLVRKELAEVREFKPRSAGFSSTGTPARLSVVRSMKMAHLRRVAMRGSSRQELEQIESRLAELGEEERGDEGCGAGADEAERKELLRRRHELLEHIDHVPFLDSVDLRYRTFVTEEIPVTQATMVCVMDNSGSMGEREKTLARKFFYLLYLFLTKKYESIDLVFIHHTESAKEVSEDEFFSTRESGGTVVSSALKLLSEMIPGRLDPSKTNLYVCQCSDGDNFTSDNAVCSKLLSENLLPAVQYWAYIQIEREGFWSDGMLEVPGTTDTLWRSYWDLAQTNGNFALRRVGGDVDIYPVFRKLFERKDGKSGGRG